MPETFPDDWFVDSDDGELHIVSPDAMVEGDTAVFIYVRWDHREEDARTIAHRLNTWPKMLEALEISTSILFDGDNANMYGVAVEQAQDNEKLLAAAKEVSADAH